MSYLQLVQYQGKVVGTQVEALSGKFIEDSRYLYSM